jgi:hypothetical protein
VEGQVNRVTIFHNVAIEMEQPNLNYIDELSGGDLGGIQNNQGYQRASREEIEVYVEELKSENYC